MHHCDLLSEVHVGQRDLRALPGREAHRQRAGGQDNHERCCSHWLRAPVPPARQSSCGYRRTQQQEHHGLSMHGHVRARARGRHASAGGCRQRPRRIGTCLTNKLQNSSCAHSPCHPISTPNNQILLLVSPFPGADLLVYSQLPRPSHNSSPNTAFGGHICTRQASRDRVRAAMHTAWCHAAYRATIKHTHAYTQPPPYSPEDGR